MKKRQYTGNLFAADAVLPDGDLRSGERFDTLFESGCVRIERIVSFGYPTPAGEWYDQDWDEWVSVLRGSAVLEYADGTRSNLSAGDWLILEKHLKHRVSEVSEDCIWLAVHISGK